MAIFNRKVTENAINEKPDVNISGFNLFGYFGGEQGKYSSAYLWLVVKQITDALHNLRFYVDGKHEGFANTKDGRRFEKFLKFVDRNAIKLWWQSVNLGYYAIGENEDGSYYIVKAQDIRMQSDGVTVDEKASRIKYLLYSDKYQLTGKSDMSIIKENLRTIDIFKDGDLNLTASGGAIGILTGKGMPMSKHEKEKFEDDLRRTFGIESRKRQIIISNAEMDFKQMKLDVKDLQLNEKIKSEVMMLCSYFNVPYDLVAFSGQSTYANQKQAVVNLYRNCLSPIAEQLLLLLRTMVIGERKLFIPSTSVTFTWDNVPELANDRTSEIEFDTKVVELIGKCRELGLETDRYEKLLKHQ